MNDYKRNRIFSFCEKKYGSFFSESIALKALTYFKDAEEEETPQGIKYHYSWNDIKKQLITLSYEYFKQQTKTEMIYNVKNPSYFFVLTGQIELVN